MIPVQTMTLFNPEVERELSQIYEDHQSWKDPLSRWIFQIIGAKDKSLEKKISILKNEVLVDPFSPGKASLKDPLLEGEGRQGMWEHLHMQTYIECFLSVRRPPDGVVPSPYDGKPLCLETALLHAPARAVLVCLQKTDFCRDLALSSPPPEPVQGTELCVREPTMITTLLLFSYEQTVKRDIQKIRLRERLWDAEDRAHEFENISIAERLQTEAIAVSCEIAEQKEASKIERELSSIQEKEEETLQIAEERIHHFEMRLDDETEQLKKMEIQKTKQEAEMVRLREEQAQLLKMRF